MKKIDELNDLMIELIDTIGDTKQEFNQRAREIIDEVSDFAEQTDFYNYFYKEQTERYKEEMEWTKHESAWNIYMHMLLKIYSAPTIFHCYGAVILLLPILRDKLREEGAGNG